MLSRLPFAASVLLALSVLLPSAASAGCLTGERIAGCVLSEAVPIRSDRWAPVAQVGGPLVQMALSSTSAPTSHVAVGDVLPRGEYSIILDTAYYGLPPVSDGWVYMRVDQDAYRVDWQTHRVLEQVTDQAAANF
jgi:hypothetical protein